ncbi:PAS domain-containing protein [Methylobacterium sp. E-016]|uniref:PAS domain-containing protein n=1 Tax=Methylobacterium sp. E-016 TaxID=2836556 RepID=UPI001FB9FDB5|nr:PAS domain-containing protein [Methylobacterium sp. E-016]MCJ2074710.1 PAS domain-containing protein [Methylobacterium sp. E-016]
MPARRHASSYQLLNLLEATGQVGVWSLNLRTGEMSGSLGLAHITGLPSDESLLGLLDRLLHPDDREALGELFDMLYSGRAIDRTVRLVRPDHTVRWVSVKAQIVLDDAHRPMRAEGIAFDVTGPHEARLLAEQSTARYRGLVHAIAAVVWTTAPDGKARPSPTWQVLTGQTGPEMQGDGWLAAIHPEDRARIETAWRTAMEHGTPYEADHRVLCADGTVHWYSNHTIPLHDADGSVREWIGIMQKMPPSGRFSSPEITGTLVRGARAMLRWSVVDLARAAGVSVSSIRRLEEEVGTVQPRTRSAMRRALEGAGIDFIGTLDGMTGVILTRDRRGA